MQQDYAESFLRSGIIEAKAGARETARRYLERAIYASDNNKHETMAEAWFWMAEITEDPAAKRRALENALSHDLGHTRARRALALLDGRLRPDEIVNPDALPPAPQGLAKADAQRFMCPKCGGRMSFAPDGQSLVCDYCTRHETLEAAAPNELEEDFLVAMSTAKGHRRPLSRQVFHCGGCGAEFTLPPTLISANCMYCGSPHVVQVQTSSDLIAPDALLPHSFDQKQVAAMFEKWAGEHKLTAGEKWERPHGLYLPIWTFDLVGEIEYTGEIVREENYLGERVPKVIRVNDRYPVYVNDLAVPATRKLSKHLARLLPGFDLRALRAYDPRYLADWPAEVYDVPVGDASLDARSQAYHSLKQKMASELGDVHLISTSSAGMRVESFRLALLPVWLLRPRGEKTDELLLINGQSGAISGGGTERQGLFDWLADLWEG